MTPTEKAYALEDALERFESSQDTPFEGAISGTQLRQQALAWFNFAKSDDTSTKNTSRSILNEVNKQNIVKNANFVGDDKHSESVEKKSLLGLQLLDDASPIPPTPCTRICRYNADFYDGAICIGCFRDSHDISNWRSLPPKEKAFALEDAADRCGFGSDGNSMCANKFGGGISPQELLRQAEMWENLSTSKDVCKAEYRWQEINILTNESRTNVNRSGSTTLNRKVIYHNFLQGHSVITMPPIILLDQCYDIIEAARGIQVPYTNNRLANGLEDEGLVRIPTIAAANRAESCNRNTPHANPFDVATNEKLSEIFEQVCDILDHEHKCLVDELFGTDQSLTERLKGHGLSFASREPAVNVYTKGGQFYPHQDGHKLTVLIPLSPSNSFAGGGTAFWQQNSRKPRVEPPSLKLRPQDYGTPILFVGDVVHSGIRVDGGERIVFVASFSPK